jgi:hypothetical protein
VTPARTVSELRALTLAATTGRFALSDVEVPAYFQSRRGDWNGRPLTLVTDTFHGAGRLARLHLAAIESGDGSIASLSVLALPRADMGAAVLGVELVAFGAAFATTILDLTPTCDALDAPAREQIVAARGRLEAVSEPRTPATTRARDAIFSEWATMVTPRRDSELVLRSAYASYLEAFVGVLDRAEPRASAVEASQRAQRELLGRLSAVKKQMKALSRLFGEDWTAAYFDSVFLDQRAVS